VDLTDDQRAKVQDIVRGGRDESAAISDELQFVRRNLHREIFADTRNAARVTELTTRIVALEKQLLDIHVKSQTAVAALLTPEQRQSVRAARADRPGGFGGPSGRGGRRAGPAVAQ
jgi:Spy/CpxP family protein refolding chaperone